MSKIESAISWMESMANNNSHGYDQTYRWGQKGDYDCSSAVITAWEQAGVPVKSKGATYTGNMYSVFLACGFSDVTSKVNRSTGAGLQRGDVLLNTVHHTAMYCGNGKEVEASINEKGTATGGKPGDQTGREFLIRSYRNYPWNKVLRYTGGGSASSTPSSSGSSSSTGKLTVDGSWGVATTKKAQKVFGTTQDGIVSNQPSSNKKYLPNAYTGSWQFKASGCTGGSALIKAIQKRIGASADGWFGPASVKAFQKWLGVAQDGSMGPATVKAFQNWLNKH